jgi:hypothetical protein
MVARTQEVADGSTEADEILSVRRQSLEPNRKATVLTVFHDAIDRCSEVLADMLRKRACEFVA